jgi:hypothetical protein
MYGQDKHDKMYFYNKLKQVDAEILRLDITFIIITAIMDSLIILSFHYHSIILAVSLMFLQFTHQAIHYDEATRLIIHRHNIKNYIRIRFELQR